MKIQVKNLEKNFCSTKALNRISFEVEEGKAFGLLGRNGAGKTTTIRILLGIIEKDSGDILIDGKDFKSSNVKFGYLPEERGLYLKYTVKDQLMYFAALNGIPKKEANEKIKYWLDRFNIPKYINKKVEELSKGNKQKIQLIAAILHDPEIIILDEPFSGLDPVNVELFKSIIKELLKNKKTILFSSHRMNDVEEFCEDVALVKNGEILIKGKIEEIKDQHKDNSLLIQGEESIKTVLESHKISRFEYEDNKFMVKIHEKEKCKELLKDIILKGLSIESFQFVKPSLNDIFLERLGD